MNEEILIHVEEPAQSPAAAPPPATSDSIFWRRLRRFRKLKRGYYAFLVIVAAYLLSFALPVLVSNKALAVKYRGQYYFPLLRYYPAAAFGMQAIGEPDYRELKARLAGQKEGWVLMPPYPYSPNESLLELPGVPPHAPSPQHLFGTDDRGRDVFARLAYGFNISLTFALLVLVLAYAFGVLIGALIGFFGGKLDILGQRAIEIWSSLPFLYTIIIVSSVVVPIYLPGRNQLMQPSFWLLILILTAFDWMGITFYVRGEFYREKAKEYVAAAIVLGASQRSIILRHILPNALTPVISFAPFGIVGNIAALVALDFLGFGLPAPTPSWGELINQGMSYLTKWWLVFFPLGAVFLTLLLIVFVGEAFREAFDPKEYSRLR
ncbi:MAG: ABC transporter permease subunit [Acidobacteria bacterium]|nr:ABC transporter permease subunit [Acidobacteriota bacterium]